MTYSPTGLSQDSENAIAGVSSPPLLRYFETFNAEAFQLTANLFTETGILYPPFDEAAVGRDAIAAYLEKNAKGMKAWPCQGKVQTVAADAEIKGTEINGTDIKVMGKVQTSLFSVNVSWHFKLEAQELDAQAKILMVRVKLLAALEELFSLQR